MTVVRRFYPEVRLVKMLTAPGGIKAEDAIAKATLAVESIREESMVALDAKLTQLADGAGDLDACYVLSNEIFAEAGVFGLDELSEVALRLCKLLMSSQAASLPPDAIKVHVDSMRLLRSPLAADSPAMRKAVLKELRKISAKYDA